LEKLNLSHNKISTLRPDAFKRATNLETVDLSNNFIENLDASTFLDNTKLSSLDLSSNQIKSLNSQMFQTLSNLKLLDLTDNDCVDADLSGKNQSYIETRLWRCNKNYYRIPEIALTCSNDDGSGESCNFYQTKLYDYEEPSFAVTNLGLGRTPADIKSVQFYYSSIYFVPASIFTYFPNLKELHLNGSKVQEIKNTFQNATNLLLIDLRHNNISTLGPDTFKGATNLEAIDLSSNQLSSIDGNAFRGLPNLSVLNLSSNPLESLDASTFLDNTRLSSLDLSNNRIKALSSKMFQTLSNLIYLDLIGNECANATLSAKNQRHIESLLKRCNTKYYNLPERTLTCYYDDYKYWEWDCNVRDAEQQNFFIGTRYFHWCY
jgi:Leucine-rich repeat (LRR) protein